MYTCCLLEVFERCSCQVNILQCTLESIQVVGGKCIKWMSVLLSVLALDGLGNGLSFKESKFAVCFIDCLVDVWVTGEVV